MTLQKRLNNLKQRIEGNMPPEFVKIMHQATQTLKDSGLKEKVLKVGDSIPDFELLNQNEQLVKAKDLYTTGPLVITFFRGVWCPYCNMDLANLKKYYSEIEARGATLLSISPELPQYSASIIEQHKLPFDVLFDQGNEVAAQFGLRFTLPEDLKLLYRDNFEIDFDVYNGDNTWTLPMPARFLVDTKGIIHYAESAPDYTQRPDPDELVEVLKIL